jgi:hypothetical protein
MRCEVSSFETQNIHVVEPKTRDVKIEPVGASARTLAPLQTLFLSRLSRMLHQEEEWRLRVGSEDWRLRLIRRAIYTTYCDCVGAGLADDARDLVRRNRPAVEIQPTKL